MNFILRLFAKIDPRIIKIFEKAVRSIPFVDRAIQKESDKSMAHLESLLKPYRKAFKTYSRIPESGIEREEIVKYMELLRSMEDSRWKKGYVSGAVYHGDDEYTNFLNRSYAINSQCNPLHADVWPSIIKFEAEIVSMTANMLGAVSAPGEIFGSVTTGGTESILLAMKAYRDLAREKRGVKSPEIIAPVTAHPAFDKAARFFNIKMVHTPVDKDYKAELSEIKKAVNENTIVIVGSAPTFPHGVIDPIRELSEIALKHKVGFHTDGCLGGFLLPWIKKLGYNVPDFDFRLPGVTSVSVDTHKYGYAPKGTSVILYRGPELLHSQYFTITDWPGGLYCSPTIMGSRSGGVIAACWASLVCNGENGYIENADRIMKTASFIKDEIKKIPELQIFGDPLWVISLGSKELDIFKIMEFMSKKSWNLNPLQRPSGIHLCVTLRHTPEGVAERLIKDLKQAVDHVKANPGAKGELAPLYGLSASLPARGIVNDFLKKYLDTLYKL